MGKSRKTLLPVLGTWTCFTRTNDRVVLLASVTSHDTVNILSEHFVSSVPAFQSIWSAVGYGLSHNENQYVDSLGIASSRQQRLLIPLHDAVDFIKSHLKTAAVVVLDVCDGARCVKRKRINLTPEPDDGRIAKGANTVQVYEEEELSGVSDYVNVIQPASDGIVAADASQTAQIQEVCPSLKNEVCDAPQPTSVLFADDSSVENCVFDGSLPTAQAVSISLLENNAPNVLKRTAPSQTSVSLGTDSPDGECDSIEKAKRVKVAEESGELVKDNHQDNEDGQAFLSNVILLTNTFITEKKEEIDLLKEQLQVEKENRIVAETRAKEKEDGLLRELEVEKEAKRSLENSCREMEDKLEGCRKRNQDLQSKLDDIRTFVVSSSSTLCNSKM